MEFNTTAVMDGKSWKHIGIREAFSSIYGVSADQIKNVVVKVSQDQSRTTFAEQRQNPCADYWAWYSSEKGALTDMVYPQYFLLNMCFPYGLESEEKMGRGKAYRVTVEELPGKTD